MLQISFDMHGRNKTTALVEIWILLSPPQEEEDVLCANRNEHNMDSKKMPGVPSSALLYRRK
jgi:hypothetical protein